MTKIVFDICGADAGPGMVVRGVAKAMTRYPDFFPVLVGPEAVIYGEMDAAGVSRDSYHVIHTEDFIGMDESPACIFTGRNESTVALGYRYLKEHDDCAGFISAGSTGALLVGSICRLGLLPGLKAPALAGSLPCGPENLVTLVDCGSNMDCTVNDFVRYAKMGNVLAKCRCGIQNPRVGIMSVGREKGKGNALTQQAYDAISQLGLNFVGNLEGSDMVSGYADVIVSDGFSGNVLLKCVEAAGKAALALALEAAKDAPQAIRDAIEEAVAEHFEINARGAAIFLGTKKPVIKMHGIATEDTCVASVELLRILEETGFAKALAAAMAP